MAATPEELFAHLDALGISYRTHRHAAVFTVAQAVERRGVLPGGHCKCLFLEDRQGGLWLVVALEASRVDLKALSQRLPSPRFSFAKPETMRAILGVEPGSVTPFALINDREHRVSVILEEAMLAHDPLNYHPLVNTMTTALAPADLRRFIASCGHAPRVLAL